MMSQTKKNKKQGTPLAPDFVPGEYDVVCAKGKAVQNHVGESVEVEEKLLMRPLWR